MRDLLLIACGAGLRDGLNPCIFMACAIFIILGLWLKKRSFKTLWVFIVFSFFYGFGVLFFNFGPAQILILQKNFIGVAKILYFILGICSLVLGIIFFKDWVLMHMGGKVKAEGSQDSSVSMAEGQAKRSRSFFIALFLLIATLSMALSALATFAPIDKYILILGNAELVKGQMQEVLPLLVSYALASMWALWFLWAFLSIKNLRPSLKKIVCASIFFTASSCMILIFK